MKGELACIRSAEKKPLTALAVASPAEEVGSKVPAGEPGMASETAGGLGLAKAAAATTAPELSAGTLGLDEGLVVASRNGWMKV